MRAKLFWKLGLTYVALLLGVLVAVDFYSAGVLRRDYVRAADDKLSSLLEESPKPVRLGWMMPHNFVPGLHGWPKAVRGSQ